MKNRNNFLKKMTNNGKFLFFCSNLNYVSLLLLYYINNFKNHWEMFYYEVFLISAMFFVINTVLYLILYKIFKSHQKTYWILFFITPFYCLKINIIFLISIILFFGIIVFILKKRIKCSFDSVVGLQLFISLAIFINNFIVGSYDAIYLTSNSKEYINDVTINLNNNLSNPNIYWIHCDGMISIDTVNKYSNYHNNYLANYFEDNGKSFYFDCHLVKAIAIILL